MSMTNFCPSYCVIGCPILVVICDKWWIVVSFPMVVIHAKEMHWVWLGQDVQLHFRECWRLYHNQDEGCKYADPLVIREGSADIVELDKCVDGEYRHVASVPKMLVSMVPNNRACKMSRPAININFSYLCHFIESFDIFDACHRC